MEHAIDTGNCTGYRQCQQMSGFLSDVCVTQLEEIVRNRMKVPSASGLLINGCVDPALVPQRVLYSGAKMPAIGLGTFGSDHASPGEVAAAVEGAAEVGYRHFDCASIYGNEHQIGYALQQALRGGIKREQLWITSKLWNDKHGEDDVIPSCRQSLTGSEA